MFQGFQVAIVIVIIIDVLGYARLLPDTPVGGRGSFDGSGKSVLCRYMLHPGQVIREVIRVGSGIILKLVTIVDGGFHFEKLTVIRRSISRTILIKTCMFPSAG